MNKINNKLASIVGVVLAVRGVPRCRASLDSDWSILFRVAVLGDHGRMRNANKMHA